MAQTNGIEVGNRGSSFNSSGGMLGAWGYLAQGIANTIAAGITYAAGKKLTKAYKEYSKTMKGLVNEYSGSAANDKLISAGTEQGNIQNLRQGQADASKVSANPNTNAMGNAQQAQQATAENSQFTQGVQEGMDNQNTLMQGAYAGEKAKADAKLEQAQKDYNAMTQGVAGGLQNIGSMLSDERAKEPINNDSGLPESDIEDSMRQLETVSYQYKDPNVPGCDGEKHESGFVAQSAEKTPLFKDAVNTGDDGIKRIDQWKLVEAVTAGIAQLQREIDELNAETDSDEHTSDENCKAAKPKKQTTISPEQVKMLMDSASTAEEAEMYRKWAAAQGIEVENPYYSDPEVDGYNENPYTPRPNRNDGLISDETCKTSYVGLLGPRKEK